MVASLWLWAGAGHVNHCVRAGLPASTTVTKRAPQGQMPLPKFGSGLYPRSRSLKRTFALLGFSIASGRQSQSPRGICQGLRAGPRLPFLVAHVQADSNWSLIYVPGAVPPAVGLMADAILERNREQPGELRGSPGTACKPGGDSEWCLIQ